MICLHPKYDMTFIFRSQRRREARVLHAPLHVHVITNNEKNLAERLPSCFPARLPFFALSTPNATEYTQGLTLELLLF